MNKWQKMINIFMLLQVYFFYKIWKGLVRLKFSIFYVSRPSSNHIVWVRIATAISIQRCYVLWRVWISASVVVSRWVMTGLLLGYAFWQVFQVWKRYPAFNIWFYPVFELLFALKFFLLPHPHWLYHHVHFVYFAYVRWKCWVWLRLHVWRFVFSNFRKGFLLL